jgi:uncharacterized protein DUF4350
MDRTTAFITVAAVLLGVMYMAAATWVESRFADAVPSTSSLSTSGTGLKVWHDYLDRLGLRPRLLTTFESLPASSTIVIAAPFENPPSEKDGTRLAAWVRSGGRVVLIGLDAAQIADGLGPLGGDVSADATSVVGPSFPGALASGVGAIVAGPGRLTLNTTDWVALYKDDSGVAVASKRMGAGEVVWLADATPVSNDAIGERDGARFAVQLVFAQGRDIYFDEYHHGTTSEVSAWTRLGPGGRAAVLLLLLGAAALIVARGRRLGPAIARTELPAARGGAYIAQLAELYRTAGARTEALVSLEDGLGRALQRRYGDRSTGLHRHPHAREAIGASTALRARGSIGKDEFVSAAARLRAARKEVEGGNG